MVRSLSALPVRIARRLRRQLEYALLGHRGLDVVRIGRHHGGGVIDAVEMHDDGTLAVVGWSADTDAYVRPLRLTTHGESIPPSHVFRVTRPDLARLAGDQPTRRGIVVEFVLPGSWSGKTATVSAADTPIAAVRLPTFATPPYGGLFGNPGVLHRDDIYGVGPPVRHVSSEILELCEGLAGPLLDFGCGAGVLVRALRARGLDAHGLELDHAPMRDAAEPDALPYLTYYSGDFPAPFDSGAFASLTCCEVLEHIPDYERAVAELARLARERVLITVPDMSAIPRGFTHGVVPWHLMERSHLNFFTQQSLHETLKPHFRDVHFFRVGEVRCDRLRFYTSLVAICTR